MKTTFRSWALAAALSAFALATLNLAAQDNPPPAAPAPTQPAQQGGGPGGGFQGGPGGPGGPRNFDPAQFQQRMNDFFRQKLNMTNDDEWNVVQPLLNKVMQKRTEVTMAGLGGFRGMMGGNRNGNRGGGGPRGMFGAQPSPEDDALQQALDDNAPKDQVKTALDNVRAVHKRRAEELSKAQDDLKQVLTLRQEATLVSLGMLD